MVFPRLVIDEVDREATVYEHASGKSVNVARVLGVLGEQATAVAQRAGGEASSFCKTSPPPASPTTS